MSTTRKDYLTRAAGLWLVALIGWSCTENPESGRPVKGAGTAEPGMRCEIDGQEVVFDTRAQAVATAEGGVLLVGGHGLSMLMLQAPKILIGTQRLKDTPMLRLDYSRHWGSSQSGDHYAANAGTPKSQVELQVDRLDKQERTIEGSFSAVALSPPEGRVQITKGRFCLAITNEPTRR